MCRLGLGQHVFAGFESGEETAQRGHRLGDSFGDIAGAVNDLVDFAQSLANLLEY